MKKLYFVFILFVMIYPQLNAQIFYNIEMPPSYQKSEITDANNLHSINYNVDSQGNLLQNNLSINVRDYLIIEKIGEKNIARVKFGVSAKYLGELTLRFSNVKLNNGANCYVYTSDYNIVAGPVYEKSISNTLNIVKIPANELILEIVFNDMNDFDLTLNLISYQSIIDLSPKNNNSLQRAISDTVWNCSNCNYGDINFVDNVGDSFNLYGASLLGAGYYRELLRRANLYSVNDLKLDAARASCLIMTPTVGEPYNSSLPGTLINFPESDCKGIIISCDHLGEVNNICNFTMQLNNSELPADTILKYTNYLNNTIIRFNWHHKYGKPKHLTECNPDNYSLWLKTIDFDEVIDYCGVRGVAHSNGDNGDYAIIKMVHAPFYKELHLGWTTQRDFDVDLMGATKVLNNSNNYPILGHHAATPTYVYRNTRAEIYEYSKDKTKGFKIQIIPYNEYESGFDTLRGWSGSQLLTPAYNSNGSVNFDTTKKFGLGLIKATVDTRTSRSLNYNFCFNKNYVNIVDLSLTGVENLPDSSLYRRYLSHHINANEIRTTDNYYWMPSKENREKCPSTIGTSNDKCDFLLDSLVKVDYINGKMVVRINIGRINPNNFPGNIYPKGIRIFHDIADQNTFYFDSFADNENIDSLIKFIIEPCDLFYYQIMGYDSLRIGIDFYDEFGKILNYTDCDIRVTIPFTPLDLCDAINISTSRIAGPPEDSCCTFRVNIFFDGCDDCSNIIGKMLEVLKIKNLTTNVETPITSQSNLNIDYLNGVISFDISGICNPTSFKLLGLFGGSKNCESTTFELLCTEPLSPVDCCKIYHLNLGEIWELHDDNGEQVYHYQPHTYVIYFTRTGNVKYPSDCILAEFYSANITRTNLYDTPSLVAQITTDDKGWPINNYGSLEGLPPGIYCFYAQFFTTHGICRDTVCVAYDGTYWEVTSNSPGPIIEINRDNNTNSYCPLTTQLQYEKVILVDINGKVIIESEPSDKIDVSNLPKGTYNVLYRNKDKIIQSQKLIIK